MTRGPGVLLLAAVLVTACHPTRSRTGGSGGGGSSVKLAVLPAESAKYPEVARALTSSLAKATVPGVDHTELTKVSLEVVQLSIECVEPTVDCYEKVGKSLAANRILFAQLAPGGKHQVRVTVTLFDVDTRAPKRTQKVFATEKDATQGIADLVAEATR